MMLKFLFFFVTVANVVIIVSSTGSRERCGGRTNEKWVECPNECTPKNCSQVGYPIPCPRSSDSSYCRTKPACTCNDGFVRNHKGICIPMKDCPSCGGDKNAVSGCGNCPKTCSNYNSKDPVFCTAICYGNACDCKEGFVLDQNTKKCVLPEHCTPVCGKNEVYSECANRGCHTGRTCDELKKLNGSEICLEVKKCDPGCLCKKGFVKDSHGVCIPENDCPSPPKCSQKNEHWEECPDNCVPRNCSQLGYPIACSGINSDGTCRTKPACVCDDGYVRDDKGNCIPGKQCPSCGGDNNAETGCGNCQKTCRNINSEEPQICPLFCNLNGCNCKKGYVKDEITKKCVLPKNCPKPCGENEVFNTCFNGGCHHGRTCKELDKLNGTKICIDPIECDSGCLCKKGYVRNSAGVCIPEYECPGKNCGGRKNEHWNDCPNDCSPKKCSELGFPVACPGQTQDGSCPVKAGCVCDEGYKRDDNGICIPTKQCPSCGGDENAQSGCANCRKTCSNYNSTEPQFCLKYCDINGCDCKHGYVLDEILNKCVLPKDCSPPCGPNEELNYCVNGGCHEAKTCKDLDNVNGNVVCEDVPVCKRGCSCKYGYLRDKNGHCIPENKCPNSKCKGDYETYVPCNYQCSAERCDQLGYPLKCLLPASGPCPGKPACLCRVGYVKNNKGKCIPIEQCPSCGGDPNARPGCGGHCGRRCSDYNKGPVACPLICYVNACDCKEGYVYDDNIGKCVVPEKCTPVCGQNEEYKKCIENSSECRCGQKQSSNAVQSRRCTAGCTCKNGFVRNRNGVCVAKNECTLNDKCSGRPNEYWDTCPPNCSPETCASIGQVIDCPPQAAVCRPGCRCAKGYKRNEHGVCVLETQCNKCGKNETYDPCLTTCPPRECGVNIAAVTCLRTEPKDCKGGCRCADGYLRNKRGDCVAEADCPPENPCLKKNEVYDVCPNPCPPRVCGIDDRLIDCAPGLNPGDPDCPPPTCRCADGYYRDNKGNCVRWEQCPKCPKHEVYNPCPNPCPPQRCSVDERVIRCKAPPQLGDKECKPGCVCEDGYKRNDTGTGACIPREKCPPRCPVNEVFDTCPPTCPPADCSVDETVIRCAPNPQPGSPDCPAPACRCKDGYKRNSDGVCIPKEECPPICYGANEKWDPCPNPYDPNTCESIGKNTKGHVQSTDVKQCKGECRCKKGYYRNKIGECISEEDCLRCTRPHEYYSCGGACDNVCSNLSQQNQTNCPIINIKCNEMCYCEHGYARDSKGNCVPISKCRSCKGKNEWYDTCPSGCPPNDSCDNYGKAYDCPLSIIPPKCGKPICRCEDNYLRLNGVCVPQEQCHKCGKNETYDPCLTTCPPRECGVNIAAVTCLRTEPKDCKGGCRCADGYLRNKRGDCVAEADCPPENPCLKKNEVYDVCPNPCPPRVCGIDDRLIDCAPGLNPGDPHCPPPICRCADGYYRDNKGNCVRWEQCPKCPKHEVYNPCPNPCPPQLCSVDERVIRCKAPPQLGDKECKPGCVCEDGYKRNDTGTGACIPKEKCPPRCPVNEVFDICPPTCPPADCSVDETVILCAPNPQPGSPDCPAPACRCKDGYKRNSDGVCIPKEECPPICYGANEKWDPCPNPYDPNTCESIGKNTKGHVQSTDVKQCKGECRCKKGYYRNKIGECISEEDCLRCTRPHEYYSCGGACDNVCSNLSQQNQTNCPIINIKCNEMCYCEQGYARDSKGNCVPISKCRSCKGKNEWYDTCPSGCPPNDSCDNYGKAYNCPLSIIPPKCGKPICRCEDNYLRLNGVCVPQEQCPCNGDPNAQPGCGCSRSCSDYLANKPPTCTKDCKQGACDCKEGYVLDEKTGKCIRPKDCPVPKCPKNEIFDLCPETCPPETCPDGRVYKCAPPPKPGSSDCKPRCRCKDGYYRDQGQCIPKDQCPTGCKGDKNAVKGCGNCPTTCSNYKIKDQIACIQICYDDACDCKKGYVLDENIKKCVRIENCTQQCGKNETYSTCVNGGCHTGRTCNEWKKLNGTKICVKPEKCESGCLCKDGYVRNKHGDCVPVNDCLKTCPGPNESWDPCPDICALTKCEDLYATRACAQASSGYKQCKGECRCNKGYYRNKHGHCVSKENCSKCTGPHEYFSCGGACDNVCATLSKQNQTNCPIVNIKCNDMCYCEKGYARDSHGICIPISDCPPPCNNDPNAQPGCGCSKSCTDYLANKPPTCTKNCKVGACDCKEGYVRDENTGKCILPKDCPVPKCPKNEIFDLCPPTCPPETCPDGRVYKCAPPPKPGSSDCKPRCRCKDGYYRDDQGKCIPKDQCPDQSGCKGDKNAVKGCGNCPTTCSNYKIKDQIACIEICYEDACDCKKGYVLDENIKKCVRVEDCTPQCGKNETYSTCVNGGCHTGRTCNEWNALNGNKICANPEKCEPGCLCKEGYVRNKNGDCVLVNDCLKTCPGPNESWDPCPDICALTKCEDLYATRACAQASSGYKQCKGECRCNKGYYRSKYGYCVSKENCYKCTGPHEYFSCGGACDNVCATLSKQNQTNCPIVNIKCNDMCYCEKGYARDSNGICIPISECPPSCNGDANAEPGCCGQSCANYKAGKIPVCNKYCAKGTCQCKKGYAWDESSKKCVLLKNCPSCSVNEEYSTCTQAICRHQECSKKGQPVACPDILPGSCLKGCVCKENFLRLKNGTCVPENLCPISDTTPTTNGSNDALQALSKGLNIFCFKFFQQVLRFKKGENVIVSPFSVQIPIAQLAIAGENETKKQLLDSLSLLNKDQIRQGFPPLLETLKGSNGVTFDKVVKLYVNEKFPLNDLYIDTTRKVFNGTPENVNCGDPIGTARHINEFVESQTNKRIQNLISPDVISELTRLIIVNAIYFQGTWKEKFNENNTKPQDFYTYDRRTVSVSMMSIETELEYTKDETLNAQVLRIYYTDSNYSFVIILPNERYGFDETVAKINADTMQTALGKLRKTKVKFYMPTMEINTDLGLVDVLKEMGITDIFDPAKSDLQGILKRDESLYVTAAVQKAFFKCNENGTEAAAATAVVISTRSIPQITLVVADHAYFFSIMHKNNVIFCGSYFK